MITHADAIVERFRKQLPLSVYAPLTFEDVLKLFLEEARKDVEGCGEDLGPLAMVEMRVFNMIRSFLTDGGSGRPPLAMSAAAESVAMFRDAVCGPTVRDAAVKEIGARPAIYLSIPHRALTVAENCQVKGVFAETVDGKIRLTAAVTAIGSNAARHFSWTEGENKVAEGAEVFFGGSKFAKHFRIDVGFNEYESSIAEHLRHDGGAFASLLRQIERLLFLSIAQYRSLADAGDADLEEEPHVPFEDIVRRGAKRKKVAHNFSLFRVCKLPHLHGVNIIHERASVASVAGARWPHDGPVRLTEVRGHFRMQPYGPEGSLRKLIWIMPFERLIACDGKTVMHVLPEADRVQPDGPEQPREGTPA